MAESSSSYRRAALVAAVVVIVQWAGCGYVTQTPIKWQNPFAGSSQRQAWWKKPKSHHPTMPTEITASQKADVEMTMGHSLEKSGELDRAVRVYSDVLKKDPRRADAHHRLAVLYDRKGECEKSEKHYRAAIKAAPRNAQLFCDFGYSCYLQQRWREAEASLRRSLSLDPKAKKAHSNLALVLARRGRLEEAVVEFRRAECSEAEARADLATVLMLEERWEEARGQFEAALAADPNSPSAAKGLETIRLVRGDSPPDPVVVAPSQRREPAVRSQFVAEDHQRFRHR